MKRVLTFAAVAALICVFPLYASGIEKNEYYSRQIDSAGLNELYSSMDEDSKEILEELGIDEVSFESLFDISPGKVFDAVKDILKGKSSQPVKTALKLSGIIILLSTGGAFMPEDDKMKGILNTVGVLLCVAALSVPLFEAVESAVSSVGMCCVFMKGLIPVLAGVLIASGNPMTALSFQTWAFSAAQMISSVCQSFTLPVVGAVTALDISDSIMPGYRLCGITGLIKKTVIWILSSTATLYISFLGIKGVLASSADSVASKGIKLIISSAVPVVGGALSEAYSGIIGSLTLVRSTAGVFGIISVAAITLPSVINLVLWILILKLCSAAAAIFEQDEISGLLDALSSALTLMNVVLLFNCVLFIISMVLLVNLKQ